MQSTHHQLLLALGGILLIGLVTSTLGHRTRLPRVTLLLLFGVLIGDDMLDIIPPVFSDHFEIIANMALLMVGFLLGGQLTTRVLRSAMSRILWISVMAAIITTLLVTAGLVSLGIDTEIAILLGCIAAATAPAAVLDVVMESGHEGPFKDLLLSIVAIDDAWALVLFAVGVAIVSTMTGNSAGNSSILIAARDIFGAMLLGTALGFPAAYLTGRLRPGQPMLIEALGVVFICGGLAMLLDVSFLIATMVMGAVITNFAKHHKRPFHAIEDIEQPFMVVFFVLAGATLDLNATGDFMFLIVAYIFFRAAGKVIGARIGGQLCHADAGIKNWMGLALLPQAGVAIGMALVAANIFPEYRQTLLSVVIGSTIFFEIIGPVFTRLALQRASS